MLTAFQCAIGAYQTEGGELLCESCFRGGDAYARPVSNYALDEWQVESSRDEYPDCECLEALRCDDCGEELNEAYIDEDCDHGEEPDPHELARREVEGA